MKWTKKVIEELINNQEKESNQLEFKRAASLYNSSHKSGKKKNDDLSKDVSSMANSNGGTIIYGIQEYNNGNNKGKAEKLDFVDGDIITEEWLEQAINSRITPKIDNVKIIKVDYDNANCIFVVDIPKSNTAHQAQDKKYYKRNNFQSEAMDDWQIKDIINRKSKPKINISLTAHPVKTLFDDYFIIDIVMHNLGMIVAKYINCFIEIEKDFRKYIKSPMPTIYENYIQITYSNKNEQILRIGEDSLKTCSYDPLLPLVYKVLGKIEVRKGFFDNNFNIVCKIATESTFNEFNFKSSKIKILTNKSLL